MAFISRVGDVTVNFGVLGTGAIPVVGILINGSAPATFGSIVFPHPFCSPEDPLCCESMVEIGAPGVLVNGQFPTYTGAMTLCGHPVLTGAAGVAVSVS